MRRSETAGGDGDDKNNIQTMLLWRCGRGRGSERENKSKQQEIGDSEEKARESGGKPRWMGMRN